MAQIEYEAVVRLRTQLEDLKSVGAALKKELLLVQTLGAEELSNSLSSAITKGVASGSSAIKPLEGDLLTLQESMDRLFAIPGKLTPESLHRPWLGLLLIIEKLDKKIAELKVSTMADPSRIAASLWPGKNITGPADIDKRWFGKNAEIGKKMKEQLQEAIKMDPEALNAEAFRDYLQKIADLMGGLQDSIADYTNALQGNAVQQGEAAAASGKLNAAHKDQQKAARGTWLVMTQGGAALQGLNLGLSMAQGNVQGMAFSLMFANTQFIPMVLAAGTLAAAGVVLTKVIIGVVNSIKQLIAKVVELAAKIVMSLIKAFISAATAAAQFGMKVAQAIGDFVVSSVQEAEEKVVGLRDELSLLNKSVQGGAADFALAGAAAAEYGRDTADVAAAIRVLRKNYLGVEDSMKSVMLLAARNNITTEEAATAYARMIGIQREAVTAGREYGVVIDEIAEGTKRADVTKIVDQAIVDQLGGAIEAFKSTATGALLALRSEYARLKEDVATPIWDDLVTPLVKEALPLLKRVRAVIGDLLGNIDFSALVGPITSIGTSLTEALETFGSRYGEDIRDAISLITDAVRELSVKLGEVDWDDLYTKAQNAITRITAAFTAITITVGTVIKDVISDWGIGFGGLKSVLDAFISDVDTDFSTMSADMAGSFAYNSSLIISKAGIIKDLLGAAFHTILGLWNGMIGAMITAFNPLSNLISGLVSGILSLGSMASDYLGFDIPGLKLAQSIFEGLKSIVPSTENAFENFAIAGDYVSDAYNKFGKMEENAQSAAAEAANAVWKSTNTVKDAADEAIRTQKMLTDARRQDRLEMEGWAATADNTANETSKSLEYVAQKAGSASDDVKKEIESLMKAWQGLVRGVMKPTMEFDFSSWQDQMTTAYDAMGRDFGKETGFGRADVWDEPVRRMLDIVNRGGESPWAKVMVPPADIMAKGNDAIKAWAAENVRQFQLGMRPDMIDWKAFVQSLREQVESKSNWESIYKIAEAEAQKAGLGVTSAQVQAALGVTLSPEAAGALQMGQNIADLFELQMQDVAFAETVAGSMATSFEANQTLFHNNARSVANTWIDAYIEGMDERGGELVAALDPLISARIEAYLINRAGTSGHGD